MSRRKTRGFEMVLNPSNFPRELGLRKKIISINIGVFPTAGALERYQAGIGARSRGDIPGVTLGSTLVMYDARNRMRGLKIAIVAGRNDHEIAAHEALHAARRLLPVLSRGRARRHMGEERLAYLTGAIANGVHKCLRIARRGWSR